MTIIAKPDSNITEGLPLYAGQEVLDKQQDGDAQRILVDLGNAEEPTREQMKYLIEAGAKAVMVFGTEGVNLNFSSVFGFLLMVTALGVAAFLNPAAIPWIVGAFAVAWFIQWVRGL
jgi:hypothetical protein